MRNFNANLDGPGYEVDLTTGIPHEPALRGIDVLHSREEEAG
jgi:hypothetical protein